MINNDFLLDNIDFLFQRTEKKETLLKKFLEKIVFITKASFGALYLNNDTESKEKKIKLIFKIGNYEAPNFLSNSSKLFYFLNESREFVVLTRRKESPFSTVLLNENMSAGIAIPIIYNNLIYAVIILNFIKSDILNKAMIMQIEKFNKITGIMQEYFTLNNHSVGAAKN
jgi:hypothetical protein